MKKKTLSNAFYRGEFGSKSNAQTNIGLTSKKKPEQVKLNQSMVQKSDQTIEDNCFDRRWEYVEM
jgi:hypothetical protein